MLLRIRLSGAVTALALSVAVTSAAAEPTLREEFGDDPRELRVAHVEGDAMSAALTADALWILVQGDAGDGLLEVEPRTGAIRRRHALEGRGAAGVVATPEGLWVLSRSEKRALRRLDARGVVLETVRATLPEGKVYGLAWDGQRLYTAAAAADRSTVYRFDPTGEAFTPWFTVRGKVQALAWWGDRLLAYANGADEYAEHWLHVARPGEEPRRLRFLEARAWGLCVDGARPYLLERQGDGACLTRFAVRADDGLVLGAPRRDQVEYRFVYANAGAGAYDLDVWLPVPTARRFQEVSDVTFAPEPIEVVTDAYGNAWAHVRFAGRRQGATAEVRFTLLRVAAAETLDRGERPPLAPAEQQLYTRATACFDHDHAELRAVRRPKLKLGSLASLVELRDYVNDRLTVQGKSGAETRASDFLRQGVGRCYAHTLSFAALARQDGLPTRAIGGVKLPTKRGQWVEVDADQVHTWNQVYLRTHGWADVDAEADDDPGGKHPLSHVGYRANAWFLTFEGNFDQADREQVFSERQWVGTHAWRSVDPQQKAKLTRVREVRLTRP